MQSDPISRPIAPQNTPQEDAQLEELRARAIEKYRSEHGSPLTPEQIIQTVTWANDLDADQLEDFLSGNASSDSQQSNLGSVSNDDMINTFHDKQPDAVANTADINLDDFKSAAKIAQNLILQEDKPISSLNDGSTVNTDPSDGVTLKINHRNDPKTPKVAKATPSTVAFGPQADTINPMPQMVPGNEIKLHAKSALPDKKPADELGGAVASSESQAAMATPTFSATTSQPSGQKPNEGTMIQISH